MTAPVASASLGDRGERGSASTQLVLVMPAVLLLVMLVVQFALWQHAGHVVTAAAQRAVTETQAERGTRSDGQREAARFLRTAGRGVALSPRVTVTRSASTARATVTARVPAVVPGLRLSVRGDAAGPVERFVGRTRR